MKTKQNWGLVALPIVCALIAARYIYVVVLGSFYSELDPMNMDLAVLFVLLAVITALLVQKKK